MNFQLCFDGIDFRHRHKEIKPARAQARLVDHKNLVTRFLNGQWLTRRGQAERGQHGAGRGALHGELAEVWRGIGDFHVLGDDKIFQPRDDRTGEAGLEI